LHSIRITPPDRPGSAISSSGHGIGAALNERIEQDADVFAFLFEQLGMK